MSVNAAENIQPNASPLQSWVFRFMAVIALALIVLPILPMVVSNLAYSFSGDAPKIYWYLSRASGFVTLTVLWAAMAMGLGITNKMVRLWPGAPTAFSIHQYASLLGLGFAVYHGLVLMGDHYTDFSLPRLATPFSIDYKTFWIGLGQTSFYVWVLVVLSFYVRQHIGQKTWRMIHYVNFAIYVMSFLHAMMSGTDSDARWAGWYFWVSGVSILALLAYRIYESSLKNKISLPKFGFKRKQTQAEVPATTPAPARAMNLPQALVREQSLKTAAPATIAVPTTPAEKHPVPAMTPIVVKPMDETPAQSVAKEKPQRMAEEPKPVVPVETSTPKAVAQPAKVKIKPSAPIETIQDNSNRGKIKVRIFREPNTMPIPELQESVEENDGELRALFIRVKQSFRAIPVEPASPKRLRKAVQ